jgi:hypothetical protein
MQAMDRDEVIQWRKAERQRLIAERREKKFYVDPIGS